MPLNFYMALFQNIRYYTKFNYWKDLSSFLRPLTFFLLLYRRAL